MGSVKETLNAKRGKKEFTSGFDVRPEFASEVINESAFTPRKIDFDALSVSKYNTYGFTEYEIEELVDSILKLGVLDYLIVEMVSINHFEILSGQKRYLAIKKIKETYPSDYNTIFPNGKILCRVVDFSKFYLFGEDKTKSLPESVKRTFIIAAANQQHEKTVRDHILQVEQLAEVYKELKEKGMMTPGLRQREFIADHGSLQERATQMVMSAKKRTLPMLWELLKQCPSLSSVIMLDGISNLTTEQQYELANRLKDNINLELEKELQRLKRTAGAKSESPGVQETGMLNTIKLQSYFNSSVILNIPSGFETGLPIRKSDEDKLKEIGQKMDKLKKSAEKILQSYVKAKQ